MRNLKLLSKILRLKGMKVIAFTFRDHGRELRLTVKPHKNGAAGARSAAGADASWRVLAWGVAGRWS